MIEVHDQITEARPQRFRRYPAHTDSGVEWLGEIPAHWEVKPLKALLVRNDSGVWGEDSANEGTIVLRSTEQTINGAWSINTPAIRLLTAREAAQARLEIGDLVVTKSSGSHLHIGKTSIVDASVAELRCGFSNFMQRLRIDCRHEARFFWYLMNAPVAREQLVFLSSTTTGLGNLNSSILGAIRVTAAPPIEQRAIAAFLDCETTRIDGLVERKERLIGLLQEKRTALINRAVTRGLDPNVPMKESGIEWLGEIPAHWQSRRLKYLASIMSGGTPEKDNLHYWSGDIPWVSPKDMKGRVITDTLDHITPDAVHASSTRLVGEGSVLLVVRSGILRHRIPVAVAAREVALNQDLKALLPLGNVSPKYLAYFIEGMSEFLLIAWRKEGATVESLETGIIETTHIPVPPYRDQRAIAAFLDRETAETDALVAKVRQAIDLLKEFRTALISAAVTGKIDVREVVA